jgi:hypothetical protein
VVQDGTVTYFGDTSGLYRYRSVGSEQVALYAFDDALVIAKPRAWSTAETLQDIFPGDAMPVRVPTSETMTRGLPPGSFWVYSRGHVRATLRRSWWVGLLKGHSKLVLNVDGKKTTLFAEPSATADLTKLLHSALGDRFEPRAD